MAKISAQELAELVPCALEHVRRLVELGILEPHEEDGLFSSSDVHVVRLMAAFEEAGISLTSEEIKPRPSSPRGSAGVVHRGFANAWLPDGQMAW